MRLDQRWLRGRSGGVKRFRGVFPLALGVALACAACASSSSHAAAVPTLGRPAGIFVHGAEGFGQVRPVTIFNGGDPTGLVSHVTWKSWGGARAVGTGKSTYVGPNRIVAQGTQQPATVVAFNLGTCHGKLMYRAVEWYFPQHGQRFDPHRYENICTGTYGARPSSAAPR